MTQGNVPVTGSGNLSKATPGALALSYGAMNTIIELQAKCASIQCKLVALSTKSQLDSAQATAANQIQAAKEAAKQMMTDGITTIAGGCVQGGFSLGGMAYSTAKNSSGTIQEKQGQLDNLNTIHNEFKDPSVLPRPCTTTGNLNQNTTVGPLNNPAIQRPNASNIGLSPEAQGWHNALTRGEFDYNPNGLSPNGKPVPLTDTDIAARQEAIGRIKSDPVGCDQAYDRLQTQINSKTQELSNILQSVNNGVQRLQTMGTATSGVVQGAGKFWTQEYKKKEGEAQAKATASQAGTQIAASATGQANSAYSNAVQALNAALNMFFNQLGQVTGRTG